MLRSVRRGVTWTAAVSALAALAPLWVFSGARRWATKEPALGIHTGAIEVEGRSWSFSSVVPEAYDGRAPWPLVLALHGTGSSGPVFLEEAGWPAAAERHGFLVVAPDGWPFRPEGEPDPWTNPRVWNSGQFDPSRPRTEINDLAFFDRLIQKLMQKFKIDRSRIYVVGHSNGGSMALRLAARRSEWIAAAASVAGFAYVVDPPPARGVPTMMVLGAADPVLPLGGGTVPLPTGVRVTPAASWSLSRWAKTIGCRPAPDTVESRDDLRVFQYGPTPEGVEMTALVLENHGHHWPGGQGRLPERLVGPRSEALDATEAIWAFLNRHPAGSTTLATDASRPNMPRETDRLPPVAAFPPASGADTILK